MENSTSSDSFEATVLACKATDDYMSAWNKFLNTRFFVPVLTNDLGPKTENFRFHLVDSPQNEMTVIISEDIARLQNAITNKSIKMLGADLIERLNHHVGIMIALSDGYFGLPVGLVAWLRDSAQRAN